MVNIASDKAKAINDVNTEMLIVGSLYKKPDLLLDYGHLIKSKYDFYHETTKFLYNGIYELYHYYTDNDISEAKINIFMNQDEKRKQYYKNIKGYETIKRAMSLSDENDFETYYNNLKKYSLLRELENKGFPSNKVVDKGLVPKLTPDQIIDGMEYQINTIMTEIGGVEDSVLLGENLLDRYNEWKKNPDYGVEIPFPYLNQLIRGWRLKKLLLTGMHSGCGKSRMTSKIACYVSIKLQEPVCLLINEQDRDEWEAMVLSAVVNNPEFGFISDVHQGVDETKIVTGTCNEWEDALCKRAAKWIEENSQLYFMELHKFDAKTLKRQIKRHKLKSCNHFVYDTLKAPDHDWQSFVKTGDMLKDISKELDVAIWATFQLTDDSLFNQVLNSQAIASGKHIKHIADGLFMYRPMFRDEYDKFEVIIPDDGFNGERQEKPNKSHIYYIGWVDKNRGGADKDKILLRVDKGKNYWEEIGVLIESEEQREYKNMKKEYKKLKTEKEAKTLKQKLGKQ